MRKLPSFQSSDFPVELRAVPLHPEDGYLRNYVHANDTLPDATLNYPDPFIYEFSLTLLPIQYAYLSAGVVWRRTPRSTVDSDQRIQQNQHGTAERGTYRSLRYYHVVMNPRTRYCIGGGVTSGWIGAGYDDMNTRFRLGAAYDLTGYTVSAVSGWDRYNYDTPWKQLDLLTSREHRLIFGWDIGYLGVDRERKRGAVFVSFELYRTLYADSWHRHDVVLKRTSTPALALSMNLFTYF